MATESGGLRATYLYRALALTDSPAATFSMFLVMFSILRIVCNGMAAGMGGILDAATVTGIGLDLLLLLLLLLFAAVALAAVALAAAAAANWAKCC